jgi:uncharacterized membrane protein
MNELALLIVLLIVLAIILVAVVLPIVALVISIRTKNKLAKQLAALGSDPAALTDNRILVATIHGLEARVAQLEAVVRSPGQQRPIEQAPIPPGQQQSEIQPGPITPGPTPTPPPPPPPSATTPPVFAPVYTRPHIDALKLESTIGRRWVGWAAVGLILFAAAFFLKYAFDNRWIGELGRVSIGVFAGVILTVLGFRYHHRGWRVFSQILTAGGVVLLYLSAYAAFGYYHLITQKAAFIYLVILVSEAAALSLLYEAPAIAIMALIGGFLSPMLLHSDRDQYRSLFGYIFALDVGALALLKHWPGLSSLAFAGTHLLFWLWYAEQYHPQKLTAVMIFQTAVFLAFLAAYLVRQLVRRANATIEDLLLLLLNPFVFFATSYHLLNPSYHDWMGVFAIAMAVVYAGSTKLLLDRHAAKRGEALILIGVAITFITLAIPIQLRSNWITMAWAVEALVVLWAAIETKSKRLHALAWILFTLALGKLVVWDTASIAWRNAFTPVLNRYFLSSLFVIACFFGAAWLYQRLGEQKEGFAPQMKVIAAVIGIITLWFLMSVEVHTFFSTRAAAYTDWEDIKRERWLGQMALSVLWALYAAALATIGFVRRSASVRWAALILFAITVVKAMIVDIAYLQQLYRIIVFFVLGVLLLLVAWAYHRAFYSKETAK